MFIPVQVRRASPGYVFPDRGRPARTWGTSCRRRSWAYCLACRTSTRMGVHGACHRRPVPGHLGHHRVNGADLWRCVSLSYRQLLHQQYRSPAAPVYPCMANRPTIIHTYQDSTWTVHRQIPRDVGPIGISPPTRTGCGKTLPTLARPFHVLFQPRSLACSTQEGEHNPNSPVPGLSCKHPD